MAEMIAAQNAESESQAIERATRDAIEDTCYCVPTRDEVEA